jgi:hypothetical protein
MLAAQGAMESSSAIASGCILFVSALPAADDGVNQVLGGLLRGEELPPKLDLRMPSPTTEISASFMHSPRMQL